MNTPFDTERYNARYKLLRSEQESWRLHWHDIAEHMAPRRGRYLNTDTDNFALNGRKRNSKIINGTAGGSLRTFAAGMQSGLTSPARPWFDLSLANEDLANHEPVRVWLGDYRDRMLAVFAGSNFYSSNHVGYEELGFFGASNNLIDSSMKTIIRCRPFTAGEYCVALDAEYKANTMYRVFSMAISQIMEDFDAPYPISIQASIDGKRYDQRHQVCHVIEPAAFQDVSKDDYRGMAYHSCYFLKGQGAEGILKKGGYKTLPFAFATWGTYGVDAYGDCPGMQVLGDVRMLQKMEEDKLRALSLQVKPPMVGPASLKNNGSTLVPGGITFVDQTAGTQGFRPAYETNLNLQQLRAEMQEVEKRIQDGFYNDLFLAILNQTKDMTATEVAQRHEEKLSMLGPAIERISEGLDTIIDRVASIMEDFGMVPPPPPELAGGVPLIVNYTSTLAQAQKLVGTSSVQQFFQFVGAVAPMFPNVVDKVNSDAAIDSYADMQGINPKLINDDKTVAAIRATKAKQQQAAQMTASAPALADAAKSASQATLGNDTNALQVMTGRKS